MQTSVSNPAILEPLILLNAVVSTDPVESNPLTITRSLLQFIRQVQLLNAVETMTPSVAIERARRAESRINLQFISIIPVDNRSMADILMCNTCMIVIIIKTKGFNLQQMQSEQVQVKGNVACEAMVLEGEVRQDGTALPSRHILKKPSLSIKNDKFVQQKSNKFEDEYTIIGRLGSGVYGDVFKIKHKILGLIRALKVIKRDLTKKYSQKEEIDVLKSLDHPNILKIYEFYQLPNFYYIVTELFEGKELYNEILQYGLFTEAKAAETAYQILKALLFSHNLKIAHRDIKLENILINSSGTSIQVKLIDWGFGSFVKTKLMRMCGTPEYAAPEIFQGSYDEKCDIWSFGVLLYVLISATFPFRGQDKQKTISLIEKSQFTFHHQSWNKISNDCKSFISRLITKDPKQRMTAEEALNSNWIKDHLKKELNITDLRDTLHNFKNIVIRNNMATAAVSFISNYLSTQEEKEKLNQVFNMLDTDGDGVLSFDEIARGYDIVYGQAVGDAVAEETFTKLDLNQNGIIQYNQFITHSLDIKKSLSNQKLKAAFKLFDSNQDGKINLTEMKDIFTYDTEIFNDLEFKNWLDDLDSDGDGEIDENQFTKRLIEICNLVHGRSGDFEQMVKRETDIKVEIGNIIDLQLIKEDEREKEDQVEEEEKVKVKVVKKEKEVEKEVVKSQIINQEPTRRSGLRSRAKAESSKATEAEKQPKQKPQGSKGSKGKQVSSKSKGK